VTAAVTRIPDERYCDATSCCAHRGVGGEASAPAAALNWLLFRQSLQCPVQLLGGREHQPSEQRWLRCGRTMQCRGCYDSKLRP